MTGAAAPRRRLAAAIDASGLVSRGERVVVLASGGPDSACLVLGLAEHLGPERLLALHVNYGLRPEARADEAVCAELCGQLGVELVVEHPALAEGNLQAAAREARYSAAERLRARRAFDLVAAGHTATDLAETVIYRLASSPGRRALLGMAPRSGRVVRPLLELTRAETRSLATEAGLPFVDDSSNEDAAFARNRIRAEVLPVLRQLNPRLERAIAATVGELAEEADAIEAAAVAALADAGSGPGALAVEAARIEALPAAIRRCALRLLAERVAGRMVALGRDREASIMRLARQPEGGEVELGGGVSAICESGVIRIRAGGGEVAEPVQLVVPGSCRFGRWIVTASLVPGPVDPRGPEQATLAPAALGSPLEVRAWQEGDRIRPFGLGGQKSLQDLFTDARVPRSLRRTLPVVVAGKRIAWVAGVAVSEDFKLAGDEPEAVVLSAHVEPAG